MSYIDFAHSVWEQMSGHKIIDVLASEDNGEAYEVDSVHLFKLDDGQFLVVSERGCSCYDHSDAELDYFDTELEAREHYKQFSKQ